MLMTSNKLFMILNMLVTFPFILRFFFFFAGLQFVFFLSSLYKLHRQQPHIEVKLMLP